MQRKLVLAAVAAVWAVAASGAETIRVESVTATPGQTNLLVRVLIDHSAPIYAMSFALRYPTAGLTFTQASLDGTVFTGAAAPEYFQALSGADYCGAAIVLDVNEPYDERTLPAGTAQFACALYFDVKATAVCGDAYALDLRGDLGSPVIDCVFTTVAPGTISKSVVPVLTDGTVSVSVAPIIASITPNRGSKDGGTAVTITGQHFNAATAAAVGDLALLNKVVVNSTTITGTTRAHAVGVVDVVASNSCGAATLPGGFTYFGIEPIVAEVMPRWGIITGGTDVTVIGEQFDASTTVTFGGLPLLSKTFVNATTIIGKAPAHAAGPVDVVATNAVGSGTLIAGFAYVGAPTIESVMPASGGGDVDIIVVGTGFTDTSDMTVLMGGNPVEGLDVMSGEVFSCHVPACGAGVTWLGLMVFTTGGSVNLPQAYNCGGGTGPTFRRGDANCDGMWDIADAIVILGYLFSGRTVKCLDALNANDSDNVDIADAIYLLKYLFTQGTPPPPPFETPGTDPTPDNVGCAESCS
ncbi:MAG TPA: hypothetical protein DCM87_15680 [Planctomycetes bacterium]|nr:hypothetical protein [Planctomycetota bacterium]